MSTWIKVTDQLPNVDLFLACYENSTPEVVDQTRGFIVNHELTPTAPFSFIFNDKYVRGFANWGGRPIQFTHWMELPDYPNDGEIV